MPKITTKTGTMGWEKCHAKARTCEKLRKMSYGKTRGRWKGLATVRNVFI
jgi:hypothetical protein